MRDLKRNQTEFWYCLLKQNTQEAIVDENGNETGELIPSYKKAISMRANISPATGQNQVEQFGNLDSYDKVIVTCDMSCQIDENTVLFIDKRPEYTEVQTHEIIEGQALYADDEVVEKTYELPKYNYIVKRVAKSLNGISIAVRKVDVG